MFCILLWTHSLNDHLNHMIMGSLRTAKNIPHSNIQCLRCGGHAKFVLCHPIFLCCAGGFHLRSREESQFHTQLADLNIWLDTDEVAQMHDGIIMVVKATVEAWYSPAFQILQKSTATAPLPDVVRLTPLLQLTPDDITFDDPILLVVPVCASANRAWRSVDHGWEPIDSSKVHFHSGFMVLFLEHFCEVFASADKNASLECKAVGYIKPMSLEESASAKFAIAHIKCKDCERRLTEYAGDADFLQDYVKCEDAIKLGDRKHQDTLRVGWNENDKVVLDFEDDFPHVSKRSETVKIEGSCRSFELNIKGRKETFKLAQSAATSALPSASRAEAPVPSEASEDPRPPASIGGVQILSSHDIVFGCELSPSDVQRADMDQVRLNAAAEPSVELGLSGGLVVGLDLQSSSISNPTTQPLQTLTQTLVKIFGHVLGTFTWKIKAKSIRHMRWFPFYLNSVEHEVDKCLKNGATDIVLIGVAAKLVNPITVQELPSLKREVEKGFHGQKWPYYDKKGERESIRIEFHRITIQEVNLGDLEERLKSFCSQSNHHAIIASCPADSKEEQTQTLAFATHEECKRAGWAVNWAVADARANYNYSIGGVGFWLSQAAQYFEG